jgi:hypothetical protein
MLGIWFGQLRQIFAPTRNSRGQLFNPVKRVARLSLLRPYPTPRFSSSDDA